MLIPKGDGTFFQEARTVLEFQSGYSVDLLAAGYDCQPVVIEAILRRALAVVKLESMEVRG